MDMAPPEKIHVDIASAEELQNVPGIGSKIAQAIIDIRDKNEGTISKLQLASIPHIRVSTGLWSMLTFEEDKIDRESDLDVGGDDYEGDESDTDTIDKITSAIDNADLMGPPPSITLKKAAASVTSKKDVPPVCIPKSKSKIPVHMDPALSTGLGTCHMYAAGPAAETWRRPTPDYFQFGQGGFGVGPKLEPPMPVYPPVNNGRGSGTGQQQQQQFPNTFTEGQCYPQGHYPHPMMYGWPGMIPYDNGLARDVFVPVT